MDQHQGAARGRHWWGWQRLVVVAFICLGGSLVAYADQLPRSGRPDPASAATATPIRHIVIIYQENHSFDNVLGKFCVQVANGVRVRAGLNDACSGATSGKLPGGHLIALSQATDVVPKAAHGVQGQIAAIDGGRMDGFGRNPACGLATAYACYTQFSPWQIPNATALASQFAVSDHTFETYTEPSWAAHLELVAATRDGFQGDNPLPAPGVTANSGWGCDSDKVTQWQSSPGAPLQTVPSCVPTPTHTGAFESTPVQWVPTIMDRLDAAGLTWRLYTVSAGAPGYSWAICPTFAECLDGPQHNQQVANSTFSTDARNGSLPNFSVLLPNKAHSQHNGYSMKEGDNWIGQAVQAVENGPDWKTTAIFITWDDCGCFYDHVPPPTGLGIRVPMIIVSPYARAGYTDGETASFLSLLAYTEHTFGLQPLNAEDKNAYDYANSFNYSQNPLSPVAMRRTRVSNAERRYIATHDAGKGGDT
jgi:phospholipase C